VVGSGYGVSTEQGQPAHDMHMRMVGYGASRGWGAESRGGPSPGGTWRCRKGSGLPDWGCGDGVNRAYRSFLAYGINSAGGLDGAFDRSLFIGSFQL